MTGFVRIADMESVRADPNVLSLKAARPVGVQLDRSVTTIHATPAILRATSATRSAINGAGVIVGVGDDGGDFAHPNFRRADGSSRILFLWDQGAGRADPRSPPEFRYGREFTDATLTPALATPDPYASIGYQRKPDAHDVAHLRETLPLPSPDDSYQNVDCDGSRYTEYMLSPGDVLYFPRGVIHEARAQNGTSIHLTLSVSVIRWSSFFKQLIQALAAEDLELRKALPSAFLHTGSADLAAAAVENFKRRLADPVALTTVIRRIQTQRVADKTRLSSAAAIEPTRAISLATTVSIAPDQVYTLYDTADSVVLSCIGAAIEFSSDFGGRSGSSARGANSPSATCQTIFHQTRNWSSCAAWSTATFRRQ